MYKNNEEKQNKMAIVINLPENSNQFYCPLSVRVLGVSLCMRVYVNACMRACVHVCMHVCVSAYVRGEIVRVCSGEGSGCVHVSILVQMCVFVRACMRSCARSCVRENVNM